MIVRHRGAGRGWRERAMNAGDSIGAFRIRAKLGEGGMGEVYRATDATLHRDVALKVVSRHLVSSPAQHARFEREARSLAALTHPNVASIYEFFSEGDSRVLVMELVEGETLAERLGDGRLSLREAIPLAQQIASALEAAHDAGIVHRDLKPANIKITPAQVVKVLDFGLAKALSGTDTAAEMATAPDLTREGLVVGTVAYMSPEQARGKPVDQRTDIWAFGCVLFEMLAGQRAYGGETAPDAIANVLQGDPEWSALPASTPGELVRLLRRALEKDVQHRWRNITDVRFALDGILTSTASTAAPGAVAATWQRWGWLAAGLGLGIVLALAGSRYLAGRASPSSSTPGALVFGIPEPPGEPLYLFANPVAVSPDGQQIALVSTAANGQSQMWLRRVGDMTPHRIESTEGATFPFWSPDGRSIGFTAQGQLRAIDLPSRAVRTIAKVQSGPGGGTWNREGTILFVDGPSGIRRVPASGGDVTDVVVPSSKAQILMAPQFLPDGRHFLFTLLDLSAPSGSIVMIGDLQSSSTRRVTTVDTVATYAAPGYLLYPREGTLVAHRFDSDRLELVGDPVVVGDNMGLWISSGLMAASASQNGVLAFATRRTPTTQMMWLDRNGRPAGTLADAGLWVHATISPDGRTVAAERLDQRSGAGTIWTIDVGRGVASKLTLDSSWNLSPLWSRSGETIAFTSSRDGISLYQRRADGGGSDELLYASPALKQPSDWLPHDEGLLFASVTGSTAWDLWLLPLKGDRTPRSLVRTPFAETFAKISPDGRWLAYSSNESGSQQVYVRPFDRDTGRRQISTTGGSHPRWRSDGKELFYLADNTRVMSVQVTSGDSFTVSAPSELPVQTERDTVGGRYTYDVTDNGTRFLVIRSTGAELPPAVTVISNWPSVLSRR
jgi:Tol biopolymer transport system component